MVYANNHINLFENIRNVQVGGLITLNLRLPMLTNGAIFRRRLSHV